MRRLALILAVVMVVAPVTAEAMTVAQFLAKTRALKSKGLLAMGSPDIALLRDEVKTVGDAYRADILAARKAGRTPHSCPPPKGAPGAMTAKDFLAELEKTPRARQGMSMKAAFYGIMKRRYPCRA